MIPAGQTLDELAAADRDAVIYWLRNTGVPAPARRRMALRMMLATVFQQAGILELVDCSRCGDRGCGWCAPVLTLAGEPA